jgi:threonyl-tRNA synthetase
MELSTIRHSRAHILAQAVQRSITCDCQLGIGPAIDDGFYYDILFPNTHLHEENLATITKNMQKIAKESQQFSMLATTPEQSLQILTLTKQTYKQELRQEFLAQGEAITFSINTIPLSAKERILWECLEEYTLLYDEVTRWVHSNFPMYANNYVTFIDMCAGPHSESTKLLEPKAMQLTKLAGAYRRGNEKNVMMTRIYWVAFDQKESLQHYLYIQEEAKKRDHRILGKQLWIFSFSDLVGAWFPLLHPNGMVIRKEIEDYLRELHSKKNYQRVWTPHLAKIDLYKISWHYEHYKENFQVKGKEEDFMVKPMNCPHHMQIFAAQKFSYRDMPVRYFEPATVYRDEKSGQLSGLTRVRAITQDDGHLFCRVDQIGEEVDVIVEIIKKFYTTVGMAKDYWVSLSVRDDSNDYLGSPEVWEKAENALRDAAEKNNLPYKRIEWEAAFYWPKLDFMFKDALGRERQLATIQCDFNLPERFDLTFTNSAGELERPVVIHRAISGSLERFIGIMIEHFAGAFPLWLSPTQVHIIPVAEAFIPYAQHVEQQLQELGLRVKINNSNDSFSKKIRQAEIEKIPYSIIVGEKEATTASVSLRIYKTKEQRTETLETICTKLSTEYTTRALS